MTRIDRLADRVLSMFVPHATAAASAAECSYSSYCQPCGTSYWKECWVQYCDGVYRGGFCHECRSCRYW